MVPGVRTIARATALLMSGSLTLTVLRRIGDLVALARLGSRRQRLTLGDRALVAGVAAALTDDFVLPRFRRNVSGFEILAHIEELDARSPRFAPKK